MTHDPTKPPHLWDNPLPCPGDGQPKSEVADMLAYLIEAVERVTPEPDPHDPAEMSGDFYLGENIKRAKAMIAKLRSEAAKPEEAAKLAELQAEVGRALCAATLAPGESLAPLPHRTGEHAIVSQVLALRHEVLALRTADVQKEPYSEALLRVAIAAREVREAWFDHVPLTNVNDATLGLWSALDALDRAPEQQRRERASAPVDAQGRVSADEASKRGWCPRCGAAEPAPGMMHRWTGMTLTCEAITETAATPVAIDPTTGAAIASTHFVDVAGPNAGEADDVDFRAAWRRETDRAHHYETALRAILKDTVDSVAQGVAEEALSSDTQPARSSGPDRVRRERFELMSAVVAKAGGEVRLTDRELVDACGLHLERIDHVMGGITLRVAGQFTREADK